VVPDEQLPERPLPPPTWRDVLDGLGVARLRIVAGVVGAVVAAVAVWWAVRPPAAPATELSLPYAASTTTTGGPSTTDRGGDVVVHAAGAVLRPGLYTLPAGSRVADLLDAAGGAAPDADLDLVNLAALVADGERVRFPRRGEPPAADPPASGAPAGPAGPVDLNAATAADLEALPGIGPTLAAAIVAFRDEHGPFASVDGLLDVPGIGPTRVEQLRPLVVV
jgi:competence protein ComEA